MKLFRLVFAFLVFWDRTDYVYQIWLSLLKGPRFLFFDPPSPQFWPQKKNIFVIIGSFFLFFFFRLKILIIIFNPSLH